MSFQDDIQGQNTQLYPIVTIEPPDLDGNWEDRFNRCKFLSTNNVSLEHIHANNGASSPIPDGAMHHFQPLLLNIPSIKESIDIESRKFKISNVSLDISNIEYEGKRFTDILSDTSLINWKVSIQFVSPSADIFSTVYIVSPFIWDSASFYEAHSGNHGGITIDSNDYAAGEQYGNSERNAKMTQMVYQGIIRRISHDDTKVRVELEDLTEKKAHKYLPQAIDQNGVVGYLGDGDDVLDKYKNKPIPMVYGHVDRSPVAIKSNKLLIDSKDISGIIESLNDSIFINEKRYSVLINIDDIYISVPNIIEEALESDYSIETQWIEDSPNSIQLQSTDLFSLERLQCRHYGFPSSISFINRIEDETFLPFMDSPNHLEGFESIIADDNLETFATVSLDNDIGSFAAQWAEGYNFMLPCYTLTLDTNPPFDFESIGKAKLSLNGYRMPTRTMLLGGNLSSFTYIDYGTADQIQYNNILEDDLSSVDLDGNGDVEDLSGLFRFTGGSPQDDPDESQDIHFSAEASDSGGADLWGDTGLWYILGRHGASLPDSLVFHNSVNLSSDKTITFLFYGKPLLDEVITTSSCQMEAKIRESGTTLLVDIKKPLTKDFYANVKGRINTFDDHPEPPADDLIDNPIDIMYDLVRKEIGHDAIDEAEYKEAKDAHPEWKFGFTVNKKINSKKLIEDIAKSTKCFPKFKNDGTFGFNTIKDTYTFPSGTLDTDDDYSRAKVIKDFEVISYSFKKTPPEQIYRNVTVSYNKDYAQDSYLKTTDIDGLSPYDLEADPYYGIEKSSDAHLEFESDYIRDKETADKLAAFLSKQYRNNHLLMNLKLPLQYIGFEVGDIIKFDALLGGIKPYGIDYTTIEEPNYQYYFPLFMITSTKKNIDSVHIECMQLHNLDLLIDFTEDDLEQGIVVGINAPEVINLIQDVGWFSGVASIPQYGLGNITAIDPADTVKVSILEERLYIPQNINITNGTVFLGIGYGEWHADNFFQDLGLDGWEDSHYRYKLRKENVAIDDLPSYTPSSLTGSDNTYNYTETYYDDPGLFDFGANLEVQGGTYLVALYVCYEVEDNLSVLGNASIPSNNINNYIEALRNTTESNDNIVGDNWDNILGSTSSFDVWKVPESNRILDSQIATKIFILPETTTLRIDDPKEEVVELESTDLLRLKDTKLW